MFAVIKFKLTRLSWYCYIVLYGSSSDSQLPNVGKRNNSESAGFFWHATGMNIFLSQDHIANQGSHLSRPCHPLPAPGARPPQLFINIDFQLRHSFTWKSNPMAERVSETTLKSIHGMLEVGFGAMRDVKPFVPVTQPKHFNFLRTPNSTRGCEKVIADLDIYHRIFMANEWNKVISRAVITSLPHSPNHSSLPSWAIPGLERVIHVQFLDVRVFLEN